MYLHGPFLGPKVTNEKQFVECETGFEHASPHVGESTTPSRWQRAAHTNVASGTGRCGQAMSFGPKPPSSS